MSNFTCTYRYKNNAGIAYMYDIQEIKDSGNPGKTYRIQPDYLKHLIATSQIKVDNLQLTSDNRLCMIDPNDAVYLTGELVKWDFGNKLPIVEMQRYYPDILSTSEIYVYASRNKIFSTWEEAEKASKVLKYKGIQLTKLTSNLTIVKRNRRVDIVGYGDVLELPPSITPLVKVSNGSIGRPILRNVVFSKCDASKVISTENMFYNTAVDCVQMKNMDLSNVRSAENMFTGSEIRLLVLTDSDISDSIRKSIWQGNIEKLLMPKRRAWDIIKHEGGKNYD